MLFTCYEKTKTKKGRKKKTRNFTKRIALLSFLYSFTPNLNKQAIKNKKIKNSVVIPNIYKTIFLSTTSYYAKKKHSKNIIKILK